MDKITFDNLPSETTAVSAENMNLMQSNVEKSVNYIGTSQPSTTEKVWFKKGKNLLDMTNIMGLGTLNNNTGLFSRITDVTLVSSSATSVVFKTATLWAGIVYSVPVLPNTQYTLKFSTDHIGDDYTLVEGYQKDGTRTRRIENSGEEQITFTTNSNEYEIKICIETGSLLNTNITISNLQLEQGSTATQFEPFIKKEILIKNSNGVFEGFYEEKNEKYSTTEQKIGTWIDGKPLYKKTTKITNTAFVEGANTVGHNISNLKQCIKAELAKDGSNIFPYFNYVNGNMTMTAITFVDSTYITIRCMNDTWGNTNVWYATLYYTKTTD